MKYAAIAVSALAMLISAGCGDGGARSDDSAVNGAGASFPAPVYQAWSYGYSNIDGNPAVNYQSVGSGAGVAQLKAGTVDFAGTDDPLSARECADFGLEQFPMLAGGVVVIVNLPGVPDGGLRLSRRVLAGMFLGDIVNWNDPEIAADNPGLPLPDLPVAVVHRADASGTSSIFTDYLSKVSAAWRERVGAGPSVGWPVGVGGQKNPGVCNSVARIRGAIGYTEYTYAKEAGLNMAMLETRDGAFVKPTVEAFSAAVSAADWLNAPGFAVMPTDLPGAGVWPITGVTYIVFRRDGAQNSGRLGVMIDYFRWCMTDGGTAAAELDYVPLPPAVSGLVLNGVLGK
ncbi:MAG: phosphate ABC transporter substrate-binding protein PstS [Victivallaceae bacterium]|nr:phosphate ABC transporter substrate-binding protein PstS [Victivallaceae bacterium]